MLSRPAFCSASAEADCSTSKSALSFSHKKFPPLVQQGNVVGIADMGLAHRSRQGAVSPCSLVLFRNPVPLMETLLMAGLCVPLSWEGRTRSPPWPSSWWRACGTAPACWHRKALPPGSRAVLWGTVCTGSQQSVPPAPCLSTGTLSGWWACPGALPHSLSRWGTDLHIGLELIPWNAVGHLHPSVARVHMQPHGLIKVKEG